MARHKVLEGLFIAVVLSLNFQSKLAYAANAVNFSQQVFTLDFAAKLIASADFNQDGIDDGLVLGKRYGRVLYGQSAGLPILGDKIDFGSTLQQIAIADFNGDQRPDLAILQTPAPPAADIRLKIYLTQADGSFALSYFVKKSSLFFGLASADFNRDGQNDLALSYSFISVSGNYHVSDKNYIAPWLGNGGGSFTPGDKVTSRRVEELFAADMNQDGIVDLLAIEAPARGRYLKILLNSGNGSFQALPDNFSAYSPFGLAVADFNLDQQNDLALLGASNNIILLQGNQNQYNEIGRWPIKNPTRTILAGDLDQNGRPDIITARRLKKGLIHVLFQQADASFTAVDYPVAAYPIQVLMANFNADAKPDLLTIYQSSKKIGILLQTE